MTVNPNVQIAIANSVDSAVNYHKFQILSMHPAHVKHNSLTS